MKIEELKDKINNLTIWKNGDQRAPHKPLLILYALGMVQRKNERFIPYNDVRVNLKKLLKDFGPVRKSYHPEHPFVRLTNDDIWQLNGPVDKRHFTDRLLLANSVSGGFTEEVYSLLSNDLKLIQDVAETVLDNHFPETIHDDILTAVGLDFSYSIVKRRTRDPKFREKILRAYGYSCAICGFNIRLAHTLVGVEAAHIKWHQAGGPDNEENGLALCSLHHKLFDRGVFTISDSRRMIVSQDANGSHGLDEFLLKYHDKTIKNPIQTNYNPNGIFLNWHIKEVFRGPSYSAF